MYGPRRGRSTLLRAGRSWSQTQPLGGWDPWARSWGSIGLNKQAGKNGGRCWRQKVSAAALEAGCPGLAWPSSAMQVVWCGHSKGYKGKWKRGGGEGGPAPWRLTRMSRAAFVKWKHTFLRVWIAQPWPICWMVKLSESVSSLDDGYLLADLTNSRVTCGTVSGLVYS